MINKKILIIILIFTFLLSLLFVSPTLTGNTIGPLSKGTSDIIAILLLFILGSMISILIKKK